MSLRCAGTQLLQTLPSALLTGASTVSLSVWVRINSGSSFTNPNGVQLFGDSGGRLAVGLSAAGALRASWSANDGGADHASSWSQSLVPGVNYHLAATWQDGAQRYYVNGLLVGSDAQHGVLGKLGDSASHRFRLGSDVAGVDVTLDEPTLWVGYALTAADVGRLRDRVAAPSTISPASIALRWTLAGPDGVTAAPGDVGLIDGSTSGLSLTSVIGGGPSYQSGVLTYSLLDQGCSAMVAPSGQGVLFKFHDAATNPSNVVSVVDNNERQSFVLSGNPAGGTFMLSFGGHTTAPIPAIPSPPARYWRWNHTLAAAGTYDLAVNIFQGGTASANVLYEVFDGPTLLGTFTLNHSNNSGNGGPTNPASFADPGGLLRHDGGTLHWFPIGRYTFASTTLAVRVSCNGDSVDGRTWIDVDNLRIATTDGTTVVRVDPAFPPGTLASTGFSLDTTTVRNYQIAGDAHNAIEMAELGAAGVRYLVDPAVVRSSLEALPSVGTGNVACAGDGSPLAPLTIEFQATLGGVAWPLLVASDAAVIVSEVAAGGLLPAIRINGGSPIPLIRDWIYYNASTVSMPGVYFGFPESPPLATYSPVKHYDNTVANNGDGNWQGANSGYGIQGYVFNTYTTAGATPTATYYFRPVTPGTYRVSATWPHDPSYSGDVVYTVKDAGGNTLGTYHTDQRAAPGGAVDQGVPWQVFGSFTLSGLNNGLVVTQGNGTSTTMIADTVRFERTSPDTSIRILPTDVVTYSAGVGWATAQAGPAPAAAGLPVTNLAGGTLYTPPTTATMQVGFNLNAQPAYAAVFYYTDLVRITSYTKTWPTLVEGSYFYQGLNNTNVSHGGDNRNRPNIPNGPVVLLWDGASNITLSAAGGGTSTETGVSNFPAAGNVGNRRNYTLGPGAFNYGAELFLIVYGTTPTGGPNNEHHVDVSNVRLYPAGTDPAAPPKYRADFLSMIAGTKSMRFMDPLGPIDGNPTDYTDYNPPQSVISKSAAPRQLSPPIHDIRQYTGSAYNFNPDGAMRYLITAGDGAGGAAPHGFSHGQHLEFSASNALAQLADDLGNTTTFSFDGTNGFVYYLDVNTFVFLQNPGPKVAGHPYAMTNVITNPTGTMTMNAGTGFPLQDMVEISNAAGVDFYFNSSFCATQACLTAAATYLANNLAPGLKLRVECSNETWNAPGHPWIWATNGSYIFYGQATGQDVPYKCEMSRVHWGWMLAAWTAAGRSGSDFIRVMAGLHADSGYTARVATYCYNVASPRISFDEFATAPYLENVPGTPAGAVAETRFGPMIDRMTAGQHLDIWEYNYTYGRYELEMANHKGALTGVNAAFFANVRNITYEGGPEILVVPGGSGPNFLSLSHAIGRHPRWYGNYLNALARHQAGGCTLFHDYALAIADGPQGFMWECFSFTGQLPYVPGDPAQDAIQVNQYDRMDLIKGVTGGAVKAWAALYLSHPSTTPPPPTTSSKPKRFVPRRGR